MDPCRRYGRRDIGAFDMKNLLCEIALCSVMVGFAGSGKAIAEVTETPVTYQDGSARLKGFIIRDNSESTLSPGVIIFSDWMGVGEFAKERGRHLAKLGYIAFAADIYGDGHQAKDVKEAGELATKFKSDRSLLRARAEAAFKEIEKISNVDSKRIAAIGFCFGGTTALELARHGARLAGLVSFHGALDTPDTSLARNIRGKILILHGADDPWVPASQVETFENEMRAAGVNWELVKYGNSVHAFTNPAAGNDNSKGAAYNEQAAKRAYLAMDNFLSEIF